ncbi:unnamed protein product, partial [Polarella glacialis]
VEESTAVKKKCQERVKEAEMMIEQNKEKVQKAEKVAAQAKETKAFLAKEVKKLAKAKEVLQDQQSAAKEATVVAKEAGAAKEDLLPGIEAQVAAARAANEEWRNEESQVWEKERDYERRFKEAQDALEAMARSGTGPPIEVAELTQLPRALGRRDVETDPMLMGYPSRLKVADYRDMPRFEQLYTDKRARERQLQNRLQTAHE